MCYTNYFNSPELHIIVAHLVDIKNDTEKKQLYAKVEKYLARAEEIKELVKTGDKGSLCMASIGYTNYG